MHEAYKCLSIDWLFNCSRLSDFQFEAPRSPFCIKVFILIYKRIIDFASQNSLFKIMLFWLLLLHARTAYGVERCQNYPTSIRPYKFREGDWFDQVRVYSGNHDYVSHFHPENTVSMFLAKYNTNCGYFESKVLSIDTLELHKGYYEPRFRERFYPFRAEIKRNASELTCNIALEKRHCEFYGGLTQTAQKINILYTDYSTLIIIHQCVDNRNYMMLLTKNKNHKIRDKVGIEKVIIGLMDEYKIEIENQTFWWPTTDLCDRFLKF